MSGLQGNRLQERNVFQRPVVDITADVDNMILVENFGSRE